MLPAIVLVPFFSTVLLFLIGAVLAFCFIASPLFSLILTGANR